MPIHDDVRAGNVEAVARQLDAGVAVDTVPENATDEFPALTPLMWAVVSEEAGAEMVRLLLDHGADANAIARNIIYQGNDKTVLSLAICHGDKSKIELLLEAGADITYRCGWSDAIFDAIDSLSWMPENDFKAGRKIRELLEFLVARGAPSQGADCVESALVWAFDRHDYDLLRFLANIGCSFDWPQWTPFMQVLMMGTGQDLERALSNASRADLEARDWMNRTPFLLCVYMGDIEKARLLLSAGSLLNDHGHCGQPTLMSAIEGNQVEMLSWLIDQGADIHARDEFRKTPLMAAVSQGETECARVLLEVGARVDATDASGETQREQLTRFNQENWTGTDVYQMILDSGRSYLDDVVAGQTVIAMAWDPEIVRMLLKAGASLNDVSEEMRAALVGLPAETEIRCTGEEYFSAKHRRFGVANPQRMSIPFWRAMVKSGVAAYTARATFDDTGNYQDEAVWCFHRFGKSLTELPDGRIIEIGGEHEDSYDTDFCIYNEVFVHHGGGVFDILGYPAEVFPPTDFHSATLVGEFIYIIGCLGYPKARVSGETPVHRLHCETLSIEKVETGGEKPGWISRHKAVFQPGDISDGEIRVWGGKLCAVVNGEEDYFDNPNTYVLNLSTLNWRQTEVEVKA